MTRTRGRELSDTDAVGGREGQKFLGPHGPLSLLDGHQRGAGHAKRCGRRILREIHSRARSAKPLTEFGGTETVHSWFTMSRTHDLSGKELINAIHSDRCSSSH